jgi:hypothetical protein
MREGSSDFCLLKVHQAIRKPLMALVLPGSPCCLSAFETFNIGIHKFLRAIREAITLYCSADFFRREIRQTVAFGQEKLNQGTPIHTYFSEGLSIIMPF